ncbi:hypothetical protein D3C72_600860 [compost metagenome]
MTTQPKPASVLEAATMPAPELKTDAEVERQVEEAVEGAPAATDVVMVGGREFPIIFLPWGVERQMVRIVAPYLRFLMRAWAAGDPVFTEAMVAAVMESETDLTKLAVLILGHHLKDDPTFAPTPAKVEAGQVLEPAVSREEKVESWLNEQAHLAELIELVVLQLAKNKLADSLGKLWGRGGFDGAVAAALSTMTPPIGPSSTPVSSKSAKRTGSTPKRS